MTAAQRPPVETAAPIAVRTTLPCVVPPTCVAVVLVGGCVATHDAEHGPGELAPSRWAGGGSAIEAVVMRRDIGLQFDVADLRAADGVRLAFTAELALRVDRPIAFLADVVRDATVFSEDDLSAMLRDTVRRTSDEALRVRTLADLDAQPDVRAWLRALVERGLGETESTLGRRSGLTLIAADARDLRCVLRAGGDEPQAVEHVVRGTMTGDATGSRRVLDVATLAAVSSITAAEVPRDAATPREAAGDSAPAATPDRSPRCSPRTARIRAAWNAPPSHLRPEIWRRALGDEVVTAPLLAPRPGIADAACEVLYVATRRGIIHAFDVASPGERGAGGDEARWSSPGAVDGTPADGMALCAGVLWVPCHDGLLFGLDPSSGRTLYRLAIGGRLASQPAIVGERLLLSVDIDVREPDGHGGELVVVDASSAEVVERWKLSRHGLRAAPAVMASTVFVGDRRGAFYMLSLADGGFEQIAAARAHILGAAAVDVAAGFVYVGDGYGFVRRFDRSGNAVGQTRLVGAGGEMVPVVGRPLVHGGALWIGDGDGRLLALDAATLEPCRPAYAARGAMATSPAGWEHLVFAGANDGYLHAVDAATGELFWRYHSGNAVVVPPAVGGDGCLFVADASGHLSALRWCLARYAEAARRMETCDPPRLEEACDLWLGAGDPEAALQVALRAGRGDIAADIAEDGGQDGRAAELCEGLARSARDKVRAAAYWMRASDDWRRAGNDDRAECCRQAEARDLGAPLLVLRSADVPALVRGQPGAMHVCIENASDVAALGVILSYGGDVRCAGERRVGEIAPRESRLVDVQIAATTSGAARIGLSLRYQDSGRRARPPAHLTVELRVGEPPVINQHFYGPYVGHDGVIIMRGERTLLTPADDDDGDVRGSRRGLRRSDGEPDA